MVATAVDGIPEQRLSGAAGDAEAMPEAIIRLLTDNALRMRLGRNAAEDAQRRFTLNRQVEAYLGLYEELNRK